MDPPMSVLGHTVVSSQCDGELYMVCVHLVEITGDHSSDRVTTLRRSVCHGGGGGGGVTLGSAGLYDLDTKCIPDVIGLGARRQEVVKVM